MSNVTLALFGTIGGHEWIIILIIALLLFGRRLPEVMRNLGRGIVEFKRGVRGIESEIEEEASKPAPPPSSSQAVSAPSSDNETEAAEAEKEPSQSTEEKQD